MAGNYHPKDSDNNTLVSIADQELADKGLLLPYEQYILGHLIFIVLYSRACSAKVAVALYVILRAHFVKV